MWFIIFLTQSPHNSHISIYRHSIYVGIWIYVCYFWSRSIYLYISTSWFRASVGIFFFIITEKLMMSFTIQSHFHRKFHLQFSPNVIRCESSVIAVITPCELLKLMPSLPHGYFVFFV